MNENSIKTKRGVILGLDIALLPLLILFIVILAFFRTMCDLILGIGGSDESMMTYLIMGISMYAVYIAVTVTDIIGLVQIAAKEMDIKRVVIWFQLVISILMMLGSAVYLVLCVLNRANYTHLNLGYYLDDFTVSFFGISMLIIFIFSLVELLLVNKIIRIQKTEPVTEPAPEA